MAHEAARSPARPEVHADALGLQRRRRPVHVCRHGAWRLGADAFTVNPLLGRDSLEPFIATAAQAGAGCFVLVRTSNPGAAELQRTLEAVGVPERETGEVLAAFAAHKGEVTEGSLATT